MDDSGFERQSTLHDHSYSKAPPTEGKFAVPTSKRKTGASPTVAQTPTCSLSHIWQTLRHRGVPEDTTSIILASWRNSTQKQYLCYQRKWNRFCTARQINPFCPTLIQLLEFLTFLFNSGQGYSSINTARSALSASLSCMQKYTVGSHPSIKRSMKGTFELRPPRTRYSYIWDVSIVLNRLRTKYPVNGLSLKQASQKLLMLIALTTAQRLQTLGRV